MTCGVVRRLATEFSSNSGRILHLLHYLIMVVHPGTRRMHYIMLQEHYWPHMSNDVCTTVKYSLIFKQPKSTRIT